MMFVQSRVLVRAVSALAALAAVLALGMGCGDEDGGDEGDSEARQEFIAQADRICGEGDAEIDAAAREFSSQRPDEIADLVSTIIVPGQREQLEQLKRLEPPEGDEEAWSEFLDTYEQGVDQLEDAPGQVTNGEAFNTILEARNIARDYGLEACARGASA